MFLSTTKRISEEEKNYEVYAIKINMTDLKAGPPKLILSVPRIKEEAGFDFRISDDSTRFLIHTKQGTVNNAKFRFAYKVIDGNLNTISEKTEDSDIKNDEFNFMGATVDKTGNVYYLAKEYLPGEGRKEKIGKADNQKSGYDLIVKYFTADGKISKLKVDLQGNFLGNFLMKVNAQNHLILFGLYEEKYGKGIKGYFFNSFSPEAQAQITNYKFRFPDTFVKRVNDIEDENGLSEAGISDSFKVANLVFHADGIYAILEKNHEREMTSGSSTFTIYNSQSILPISIDNSGKEKWFKIIPKYHYDKSDSYFYHYSILLDSNLVIFYNDNKDNLENALSSDEKPEKLKPIKDMVLVYVVADASGKLVRKTFIDPEKSKMIVDIKNSLWISDNTLLFDGFNIDTKEGKLGKVVFN